MLSKTHGFVRSMTRGVGRIWEGDKRFFQIWKFACREALRGSSGEKVF